MKEIKLTQGKVALVDDEDYEYLNQWKWCVTRDHKDNLYAKRSTYINKKKGSLSMHRLIMNTPEEKQVDHIDHNGLNNQKSNLRNCTHTQNCWNKIPCGKSKYLGVTIYNQKGKYYIKSAIRIDKKSIHIGQFKTEEEAALAYDNKAKEIFGEFANLNFKGNTPEAIFDDTNLSKTEQNEQ